MYRIFVTAVLLLMGGNAVACGDRPIAAHAGVGAGTQYLLRHDEHDHVDFELDCERAECLYTAVS